jgi:hypothetical protein
MLLGKAFSEARAEGNLTGWALSCFREMVQAVLCELDEEAASLLRRAEDWLEVSVRENERLDSYSLWDPDYLDAERFRVLGLCRWLRNQQVDEESFSSACDARTRYLRRQKDKLEVALSLPTFVLAGRYDELLAHFRACKRLAAPGRLKGIQCPGKMTYLIATYALAGDPDRAALEVAFRSFLKFMIPVCLNLRGGGFGLAGDVPTWTFLEERYFSRVSRDGFANIRRVLPYLEAIKVRPRAPRAPRPRAGSEFARAAAAAGQPGSIAWPKPIELSRVVIERGLLQFIGEILGEQPAEAPVGALTLRPVRPERDKKVRALVYVGPLGWRTPDQIKGLVEPKYAAGHAWELEKLLKIDTATAEDPLEY